MRRRLRLGCLLGFVAALAIACGDDSVPGTERARLLWDAYYGGGEGDAANAVAVCDGRTFVVGTISLRGGGGRHYQILAYDQRTGGIIWGESRAGSYGDSGRAVACGNDTVVAEYQPGRGGTSKLMAYRADSYGERWRWFFPYQTVGEVVAMQIRQGRLFLLARETTEGGTPATHLVTRAVSVEDGSDIWEDRVEVASWATADLDVGDDRVCILVVDAGGPDPYSYAVRCLRRGDGTVAWERKLGRGIESHALSFSSDSAIVVAATGERDRPVLRAFSADDGAPLWSRSFPNPSLVVDMDAAYQRLLVAGVDFSVGATEEQFVQGLDPVTGATLWEHRVRGTQPRAVAVDRNRLVVGGVDWDSWVYDTWSGRLLVDEPTLPEPPNLSMLGIAAEKGRYFLVGAFLADPGDTTFGVRAYSAR